MQILNEGYDAPYAFVRGSGCRLEDDRGRRFVDLSMGGGTLLLGHAHPRITAAAHEALARGVHTAAANPHTFEVAARLSRSLPWSAAAAFCSTGSEATLRAIRIARAVTGRSTIALFGGNWHGSHDGVLFDEDYDGPVDRPATARRSAGLPDGLAHDIVMLPYNTPDSLAVLDSHGPSLAGVIVEPMQGSNPRDDIGPFLRQVRAACDAHGALLILDEIITGFRLGYGSAASRHGVIPDLACFGKALGAGYPIGVVVATDRIRDAFVKGTGHGAPNTVYFGGTFSANPLSMAVAAAFLAETEERQAEIYGCLDALGARLTDSVNDRIRQLGLDARMGGVGSFRRLFFTADPLRNRRERDALEWPRERQLAFYERLRDAGVHFGRNGLVFLSTAHDEASVDAAATAIIGALQDSEPHRRKVPA